MATPLQCYFAALATKLNIDIQSTIIQQDNARTIKGSFDDSVFEIHPDESMISRWMETSSSSDVTLSVPGRRNSIEMSQQLGEVRTETSYQDPRMDATERWLLELPLEGQGLGLHHDEIPTSAQRVRSFDDEIRTESFEDENDTDEDIPLLRGCRFGTDEKYPASNLLALDRDCLWEKLSPTPLNWSEDSREDTSTPLDMQKVASVKRENLSTCKNHMEDATTKTVDSHHSVIRLRQKGHFSAFGEDQASPMVLDRKASFE
eukprot:CAMPEP_0113638682 /NCGR_PEP_ID=MMETSP0017_2-20120614/20274_1 /TAXON_ID=2856 /ORGANISM="Cylindrotheca closterium" /LENGTH=260 /DNA_ID=CAMNT_0000549821 /DNA_START=217 /DNA_END=999 /DNA_ORIENTATION=- /assembly_acc=CAM_ASM_000147